MQQPLSAPASPARWLDAAAAARPDGAAMVTATRSVDYEELDDLAARSARALHSMGVVGGTRIGVVVAEPSVELIALMWGVWRLGAAVMPLDPHLVQGSGAADELRLRHDLVEILSEVTPDSERWEGADHPKDAALHSLVLTSGSEAGQRACLLTHGNVVAAVAASQQRLHNDGDDRWLLALPLFHVGGLSILWRSAAAGGTVVLHPRFDATAVATAMATGAVTIASLVPTMLGRVLDAHPGPYEGLKAVLLGGAAAPRSLVERGLDAGLPLLSTYGMTETCSQIATVRPGDERASFGTVGLPLEGMTVAILGGEVPGDVGRIVVSGPAVSPGYDGEPMRQGPLVTSDLGSLDVEGRLTVVGRVDDVIVTGGTNVHPGHVESVLAEHPSVAGVAVVGVADLEWGEVVTAIVVGVLDSDLEALDAFARDRLSPPEVPKRWVIVSTLPMLANGKPDRASIRTIVEEGHA